MADAPSPPQPPGAPALRASDADRERTVDVLRAAGADGRLDIDELDERVSAAYATRTLTQLRALTADLVAPGSVDEPHPATDGHGPSPVVGPGPGATERIISVMGRHERHGRWRVAARCLVLSVMGGAELDLSEAELSSPTTTIRVVSIMGGADLSLPHGVDVRVSKFALMGGHDVRLDPEAPPPGAPTIHLRLLSIMGGCEVRQGPRPRRRRERRLDRRQGDRELE